MLESNRPYSAGVLRAGSASRHVADIAAQLHASTAPGESSCRHGQDGPPGSTNVQVSSGDHRLTARDGRRCVDSRLHVRQNRRPLLWM